MHSECLMTSFIYAFQLVIDKISILFRNNFRLELTAIIDYFPDLLNSDVIAALRIIINESRKIINKYGFPSYLKESNNIYFLTSNLSLSSTYFLEFYNQNPIITISTIFLYLSLFSLVICLPV